VVLIKGGRGLFVLKVANSLYRTRQLQYEYEIMRGLAKVDSSLPTAEPLILIQEGGYTFLLQSCIEGYPRTDAQLNNSDGMVAVARLLGTIHEHRFTQFDYSDILDRQLRLAERNMQYALLDPEEFEECGSPASTLGRLKQSKPTVGEVVLLHGDYRPKNILWKESYISGIIDWGLAMPGDTHYDLAIMLWYIKDNELKSRALV
jgi:aminoglycoside 3'-phosphotransferase-2